MSRCVLAAFLASAVACSASPTASVRPIDPALMVGKVAEPTRFERRDDRVEHADPREHQKARTIAFWTGVALTTVGAAGTIAFSATGQAMENKLSDGYDDSLTRADEDRYQDNGELMNDLAIASGVIGLAGVVIAAVAFGVDYTLCGTLVKRRKDCDRWR